MRRRKQGRNFWLRQSNRLTCSPKIGHDSEEEAQAHLDALVANRGAAREELNVYRCLECHKLHVGHTSKIREREVTP